MFLFYSMQTEDYLSCGLIALAIYSSFTLIIPKSAMSFDCNSRKISNNANAKLCNNPTRGSTGFQMPIAQLSRKLCDLCYNFNHGRTSLSFNGEHRKETHFSFKT
uniref:Uncharacterized protein n=1 Tax=Glossina palpalis gambiensis TaxID=67801 RepID=A0A1B0BLI6_9MUSC